MATKWKKITYLDGCYCTLNLLSTLLMFRPFHMADWCLLVHETEIDAFHSRRTKCFKWVMAVFSHPCFLIAFSLSLWNWHLPGIFRNLSVRRVDKSKTANHITLHRRKTFWYMQMWAIRMFLNVYTCTRNKHSLLWQIKGNWERKVYVYSTDEGLLKSYIYVSKFQLLPWF